MTRRRMGCGVPTGKGAWRLMALLLLCPACARHEPPANLEPPFALSAPGRVEGVSPTVDITAAMDGRLEWVAAKEGDRVVEGQELARLSCADVAAEVKANEAAAEAAQAGAIRIRRGAREEERRVAYAEAEAAEALKDRARDDLARLERLYRDDQIVPEQTVQQARRNVTVALAQWHAASERRILADAGPLPEETARAEAEARTASLRVDEAKGRMAKCSIRAPFSGVVLRRHREAGESVSMVVPTPVFSLADTTRLSVRAEVDERDVSGVLDRQPILVTADALGTDRLSGLVRRRGALMGRKHVRTSDPAEKADRDVLEVEIDLDRPDPRLVVGLRVTVLFVRDDR